MITYTFEPWETIAPELLQLMESVHAPEASQFQEHMRVKLDEEHHQRLDAVGILRNLAVRDDGRLIGYHIAALMNNPHFVGIRGAYVLHYFLEPTSRGQGVGSQMFRLAEEDLRGQGIECVWSGAKTHLPFARLYEHLGWTAVEVTYSKWIGKE